MRNIIKTILTLNTVFSKDHLMIVLLSVKPFAKKPGIDSDLIYFKKCQKEVTGPQLEGGTGAHAPPPLSPPKGGTLSETKKEEKEKMKRRKRKKERNNEKKRRKLA